MSSPASEPIKISEIVRAGAGAGKTRRLTHEVVNFAIDFKQTQGRWPRVLVTTFTRKATQELRERLMLHALSNAPEAIEFVNSRSHLMVSTIHGILDLFLKRNGHVVGLEPGYSILDSSDFDLLAASTLKEILLKDQELVALLEVTRFSEMTKTLRRLGQIYGEKTSQSEARNENSDTTSSRAPVRALDADALHLVWRDLLANLESDVRRLVREIRSEAESEDWLKLCGQLEQIAEQLTNCLLNSKKPEVLSETWTTARARIESLRAEIKLPRASKKNPALSEACAERLAKLRERLTGLQKPEFDSAVWLRQVQWHEKIEKLTQLFAAAFRAAKLRLGQIEIADLEILTQECLQINPETAVGFAAETDFWLVDEFQDTSPNQVQILESLSQGRPMFLVGDPQQSIYLFRGARTEVFSGAEEKFRDLGFKQDKLDVNYRSSAGVLSFINSLVPQLSGEFETMRQGRVESPSEAHSLAPAVEVIVAPSQASEMAAIAASIQERLELGARPAEICCLARTRDHLNQIANQLTELGISVHLHSGGNFYDRREIRDALALYRFLLNPHDDVNCVELLRSPWFSISDQYLSSAAAKKGDSLWLKILELPGEHLARETLSRAQREVEELGVVVAYTRALKSSGLIDFSHLHDSSGRRESNIWKLLHQLSRAERAVGFQPQEFLDKAMLNLLGDGQQESDASSAFEPDRVSLMTVHAAKGLQFKHVYLPFLDRASKLTTWKDLFFDDETGYWAMRAPVGDEQERIATLLERAWVGRMQQREAEESERVFYVAVTRAVQSLTLSWSEPVDDLAWAKRLGLDLSEGTNQGAGFEYTVIRPEPALAAESAPESAADTMAPVGAADKTPESAAESRSSEALGVASPAASSTKTSQPRQKWAAEVLAKQESQSVTGMVRASKPNSADFSPEKIQRVLTVTQKGTQAHRVFEALRYRGEQSLSELAANLKLSSELLAAMEYVDQLREPPMAELLKYGYAEWGFIMKTREPSLTGQIGGQLVGQVEGQIDLWGIVDNRVWIVDYKTGSSEYLEQAFAQLEIYAQAVKSSRLAPANASYHLSVIYPLSREVHTRA